MRESNDMRRGPFRNARACHSMRSAQYPLTPACKRIGFSLPRARRIFRLTKGHLASAGALSGNCRILLAARQHTIGGSGKPPKGGKGDEIRRNVIACMRRLDNVLREEVRYSWGRSGGGATRWPVGLLTALPMLLTGLVKWRAGKGRVNNRLLELAEDLKASGLGGVRDRGHLRGGERPSGTRG